MHPPSTVMAEVTWLHDDALLDTLEELPRVVFMEVGIRPFAAICGFYFSSETYAVLLRSHYGDKFYWSVNELIEV